MRTLLHSPADLLYPADIRASNLVGTPVICNQNNNGLREPASLFCVSPELSAVSVMLHTPHDSSGPHRWLQISNMFDILRAVRELIVVVKIESGL